jgi:hypothetical protein
MVSENTVRAKTAPVSESSIVAVMVSESESSVTVMVSESDSSGYGVKG